MNQQQQQDSFYGYPNALNRSPSSTRQGYATVGMPSGRQNQRPLDPIGQAPSNMYGTVDDRFNSFDNGGRYDRMTPTASGLPGSFMMGNNQAWQYNAGSVATVNGAMNDGMRSRIGNRRQPLPDVRSPFAHTPFSTRCTDCKKTWIMPPDQASMGSAGMHNPQQLYASPALPNHPLGHMNAGPGPGPEHLPVQNSSLYSNDMRRSQDDKKDPNDLIPTAIVIKNIPFNVRKEQLAAMMIDLSLPQPYAFNYHFDNGVFRGLAFANFQSPTDTAIVIERMNQMEVGGRKLRVEYKKMLPEHERERIEREKREKRGQLEEQHRPLPLQHQTSMHSLTGGSNAPQQRTSPMSELFRENSGLGLRTNRDRVGDIDLNNPETLNYYTELTLFRNDPAREILIFPNDITPEQRRQIHVLAHNMGLEHQSVGDGAHRQIHVMKRAAAPQLPAHLQQTVSSLDAHRRGLSRAATIDFAESRNLSSSNYHTVGRQGNPTLELPGGSPDAINGLRGVKSFADLRSYSPSPSPSTSSYVNSALPRPPNGPDTANVARYGDYGTSLTTPTTPGGTVTNTGLSSSDTASLVGGMGSLGLGGGFDASGSHVRSREAPGAIGSQRPGMNGSSTRVNAPERQPRGPEWEASTGFSGRGRANGHMQRGSGSSNLTSQDSYSDLLTGSRADSSDAARHGNATGSSALFH
ncbi:putative rna-binding post-transcriptional regulator cip2 protein [Phaeoacremonium minimum UCRPA7]|uniref:Putative rna-binding post-transcriptional regulator cip2 protein n=1 Tax=Phaeoacremonium minimum (strain UCR-PA7) TaxID=1286976 RepID=R8BBT3_PHAM7|nr:putative rna-binding post-transcriptional regulator cip2 protein [Phaeoacremonium minimum UCRPA7]EON96742.1 putative rna-binding post-transcriptional regulator cip2 protein [Phaeoacremonium minimum UCRPA7]